MASKPLRAKVQLISKYPVPQSLKSLRRLLGINNYYYRFIPNCSAMLQPLTYLLYSNPKQLALPPLALDYFHAAKSHIASATMLFHYSPGPQSELSVRSDVSQVAVGAVPQQMAFLVL